MRAFDLILSFIGLVILSPFSMLCAILVRLSSPGPVIFTQERVGLNGRIFRLYKFRTMVDKAEQLGTSVTAGKDPRITSIGRILRKTKLDELPQLWNVLMGDMSFVGPRPDVPEIINRYTPEMKRVLEVRPGITSNATLYLRNEEDLLLLAKEPDIAYEKIFVPAKVRLAIEHVDKNSILFDLSILLKTVWFLTIGKVQTDKEHEFVRDIKEKIEELNN